ncbi:dGTP triphosphohydrolase [Patulibacter sp. SYSU D01012]|uniref:dGTP triphosphohydrolase n=1 Tax=Patulibacter sp. SYSU D01012 TaxID=2817381 RepID=UPI001B30065F|nr:dNTP triphosphohydrolase [Patulibacter sp. SYSU D01012]
MSVVPQTATSGEPHARRRAFEDAFLDPRAARTWPPRRAVDEPDDPLRTPLQRDRDRVVHSKAFRRLKHKTQVFLAPEGDHYRTRLTHTLEVTGIARTVARALDLNEDLVEAIGLAHDLGHAPFGHIGEEALDACLRPHGRGFRHWEHSVRIITVLEDAPSAVRERGGRALNLCGNVVDGVAGHSGRSPMPATLEGRIVRIVDRIAYLNHDIDDAIRAGVLREADLPAGPISVLGATPSRRIDRLVGDLVATSREAGDIRQGGEAGEAMDALRTWMFEHVYLAPAAEAEHRKAHELVRTLFEHHLETASAEQEQGDGVARLPLAIADGGWDQYHVQREPDPDADALQRATDWVAGMTDRYALRAYADLVVPRVHAG